MLRLTLVFSLLLASTGFADEYVTSRVDVDCIQSYADNDGYEGVLPTTAVKYAEACREVVSTEACTWIKKSPDGRCVLKLQEIDKYGTVLPATLQTYRDACAAVTYSCK